MENDSTFSIFKIGPELAKLLSIIEHQEYGFKIADYNAVVWDWNGHNPWYIDGVEESCFVLTKSNSPHPSFEENICLSYDFDNPKENDSTLVGLINHEHKYKNYPNIVDGKITFYDYSNNEKERLISLPHEDLMYSYIDEVIGYMNDLDSCDISSPELQSVLKTFVEKKGLINTNKLQRKKV